MKISRDDDPSHFLHQSYVYDDHDDDDHDGDGNDGDDDSSSSEFGWNHSPQPQQPPPPPPRNHFCVICNKQFSSGKAYGGHVRIHSSEYNNNNKGKTKKMKMKKKKTKKKRKIGLVNKEKKKEIDLIRADVESKIRCCLCGKVFQTMHSLFGHMRRHPDRSWKGIRPPPSPKKFKFSFLDDVNDYDDVMMSGSMMMSDAAEDVQVAAYILMMMYYSNGVVKKDMVTPKSEVRSRDGEMDVDDDDDDDIEDRKTKMELRDHSFDLNQPYHDEDHPYDPYWN